MIHDALQRELDKIEAEARQNTEHLLASQETFLRAEQLVWILKTHGAHKTLHTAIHYHWEPARIFVYPAFAGDCRDTIKAIVASGVVIDAVESGYDEDVARLVLRGYEDVWFHVSRSALMQREAVKEAGANQ